MWMNERLNKSNLNVFRSRTKENRIRPGKVESRWVVNFVYSNPYEVSWYTNKCVKLNYYHLYEILIAWMDMRAQYVKSEKVSIMQRRLKSPVRTIGIVRIHMSWHRIRYVFSCKTMSGTLASIYVVKSKTMFGTWASY